VIWRKDAKMDEPQFVSNNEQVIKSEVHDEPQNEPQNEPQFGSLNPALVRCRKLLETIIAKPTISRQDLAYELGVSLVTIKRDMIKLRESYTIEWQGPTLGGRWVVKQMSKK